MRRHTFCLVDDEHPLVQDNKSNEQNDNNNHDRTDSEKLTSKALLDKAARELELVKIELGWKEKRMSAMKSRLDQLQRQKEKEDGSARVGAFNEAMLCEVCRNAYQSPVLLIPCGHSFCSGCLDTSGGAEEMKCFECQSDVTGWVENHGLAVACECAKSVQERWN